MAYQRPPATATRRLSDRDMHVLQAVGQFRQLTPAHIKPLIFHDTTYTPVYRSLERLTEMHYLAATERLVASGRGGSGRYVYSLSRDGFNLLYIGEYQRARVRDTMHTLAIADCAVALHEAHRADKLRLTALLTEPDCHVSVGGHNLYPDMFAEFIRGGETRPVWFEVQRSYKSPKNLDMKFRAYYNAYRYTTRDEYPQWPTIFWIAIYPEYANTYRGVIATMPAEARQMFRVTTLDGLASIFG